MSTNPRTWKKAEGRVAGMFGVRRQILSGSSGRDDITRSDTTHRRLFVEAKYRQRHAVRSLYDETKAKASGEGKTPVVALIDEGRHGYLVCVHSDDLSTVVAEFTLSNPGLVEQAIRRVRPVMPQDLSSRADDAAA